MRERLLRFFHEQAAQIREAFLPPTYEELLANFPHAQGCPGDVKLRLVERTVRIPEVGPWVSITSTAIEKSLRCDTCEVQKPFIL